MFGGELLTCTCKFPAAATAGIVIGVVAVLLIGAGLAVFLIIKAKKSAVAGTGSAGVTIQAANV